MRFMIAGEGACPSQRAERSIVPVASAHAATIEIVRLLPWRKGRDARVFARVGPFRRTPIVTTACDARCVDRASRPSLFFPPSHPCTCMVPSTCARACHVIPGPLSSPLFFFPLRNLFRGSFVSFFSPFPSLQAASKFPRFSFFLALFSPVPRDRRRRGLRLEPFVFLLKGSSCPIERDTVPFNPSNEPVEPKHERKRRAMRSDTTARASCLRAHLRTTRA